MGPSSFTILEAFGLAFEAFGVASRLTDAGPKLPSGKLSAADVGDIARPFTVHVECQQAASRVAAAPTIPIHPPPSSIEPTQQQKKSTTFSLGADWYAASALCRPAKPRGSLARQQCSRSTRSA